MPFGGCRSGRPLLLDGGMAHQLKRMGVGLRTKRPFDLKGGGGDPRRNSMERVLGVALANTRTPRLVRDAHLAYIDAGADVITTNNYAVVTATLRACEDVSDDGDFTAEAIVPQVLRAAGRAARAAVEERPERDVKVAGCLPPLHDSYEPDLVRSYEDNLEEYRLIVDAIAPYSDLLLCETMSTAQEARAAVQAGSEAGLPVWCSWTLDEQRPVLRSGETLSEALEALGPELRDSVAAYLFNCTSSTSIRLAIAELLKEPLLPETAMIGGYANGWVATETQLELGPSEYSEIVGEWLSLQDGAGSSEADGRTLVVGGFFIFTMMNFVFKMMKVVFKMTNYVFKIDELCIENAGGGLLRDLPGAHRPAAEGDRRGVNCNINAIFPSEIHTFRSNFYLISAFPILVRNKDGICIATRNGSMECSLSLISKPRPSLTRMPEFPLKRPPFQ